MAVRLSGLASGLDTDSIVKELVSAYSTKKDKYVKQQTKMEWTMDAWKTTNSKVYSFYSSSLSNMRYSSNYNLRTASISNSSVATVSASANSAASTQSLTVSQLATSGYLTGGKIQSDTSLTNDSKLSDLGITSGRIMVNDKSVDITSDMTISGFVSALKGAGVSASFDANSQRLFVNSTSSGADKEFTLTAGNANGLDALTKLGLFSTTDTTNNKTADLLRYEKMAASDYNSEAEITKRYDASKWTVKSYTASVKSKVDTATKNQTSLQKTQDALIKQRADMKKDDTETEEDYQKSLAELDKKISDNAAKLSEYKSTIDTNQALLDDSDALKASMDGLNNTILTNIQNSVTAEVNTAKDVVSKISAGELSTSTGSARITAQDAMIMLNGAEFTNSSNSFSINGLNINVTATTDTPVTITTSVDTQGIYDKIKSFISSYNEMIGYIDTQYYATSSSGYEPLTDDEKESMTDTQIESWEKKIKDALLRKDSTLGDLSSSLKSAFLGTTATIGGKEYSLSSFGIATGSYFSTDEADRGKFHIDGNSDDALTASNSDKLLQAISNNPDAVVQYFQTLSQNVYDVMSKKMASSSISSAFTIYNDKEMSSQYSDYTDKVSEWEDKLKTYEDYYYKKFSSMETALSKLQSQTQSLSNLLGS